MAGNDVVIDFPFAKVEADKKFCESKLNETIQAACALFNSDGGILKLRSATKETFNFDKLIRKFEQRIKEFVGCFESCKNLEVLSSTLDEKCTEVVLKIASSETFRTLNYHLYVPHETQVNLIAPTEPLKNIRSILNGPRLIECDELIKLGSHRDAFIKGQNIGSPESKTEQFKKVKHEATKNTSLADRMVGKSSRFSCYVSAFANHRGGHIYYGIKDDGLVEGEILEQDDQQVVTARVNKAISKMIWPNNAHQRGIHWDIFFEPLVDNGYKQIPSAFVIVVTVVQCSGGVFVEKPESYRLVNGKPEAIPFEIWKKRVTSDETGSTECDGRKAQGTKTNPNLHRFANRRKVPTSITRRVGGTSKTERSCLKSRERLARLRNNGNKTQFENYAKELAGQKEYCFKAIVWQQRAACRYREHKFEKAYECLQTSKTLLTLAHEKHPVLEVENLYWESLVSCLLGNYEDSNSYRLLGMQRMESCPPDVIGAWFFFQEGRAIERRISQNPKEMSKLVPEAIRSYLEALGQASVLEESTAVAELKQRCHNRLAMLHLGCFFYQTKITRREELTEHDIEEAQRMLGIVDWSSRVQGWSLTEFCRCEYLLARAEQSVRNWQQFQDESFLDTALEDCRTARDICEKKDFKEMMNFVEAELNEVNLHLRF